MYQPRHDRKPRRSGLGLAMKNIAITFLFGLAIFNGCRCDAPEATVPALATEPLLIGLIPETNIFEQMARYEPVAAYLSARTDAQIQLKVLTKYGSVVENFESLGLDGAFFGSFGFVLARRKLGVEPVARPEAIKGGSTYHGVLFVRSDSGINTLADMKAKRFAFVAKETTAGYLFPLRFFREFGLGRLDQYFSEVYFAGTHSAAIRDVLNGQADIGAAKSTVFARLAEQEPRVLRELTILAKSPAVPENALALGRDVDPTLRKQLREALLGMDADPAGKRILHEFGARRFVETRVNDYQVVEDYLAGIELEALQSPKEGQ